MAALAADGNRHAPTLEAFAAALESDLRVVTGDDAEADARCLTQRIALAMQGALLVRHAPSFVTDAFCASRLAERAFAGGAFGALPPRTDRVAIIARALPA